jgi:hypothetical protein
MLYDHLDIWQQSSTLSGLPSGDSAEALVRGEWKALPTAALHTVLRGVLIGTAMSVAGMPAKDLVRYSLAGALGIEVFVLVWAWMNKEK